MIISIYKESWIIILQISWNFSSYLFYFSYWEEGLIVFTKGIWNGHLKKWNREKCKKHKENYRTNGKSGKMEKWKESTYVTWRCEPFSRNSHGKSWEVVDPLEVQCN